jgi:hypothetical protein
MLIVIIIIFGGCDDSINNLNNLFGLEFGVVILVAFE